MVRLCLLLLRGVASSAGVVHSEEGWRRQWAAEELEARLTLVTAAALMDRNRAFEAEAAAAARDAEASATLVAYAQELQV
jgi:hypothetical protein